MRGYFLVRLPRINFCEELIGLSFRCVQPIQQQGRRIPSLSSEHTRSTCSRRLSGLLTEMVQQIHSLRASGVISSHFASAFESEKRAFFRSAGSRCATPPEIFLVIGIVYKTIVLNAGQSVSRKKTGSPRVVRDCLMLKKSCRFQNPEKARAGIGFENECPLVCLVLARGTFLNHSPANSLWSLSESSMLMA